MAALNQTITGKVAGDDLRIDRQYIDLPTGITITKAWFTIKNRLSDADADAVLGPKEITTSATDAGQITDATSTGDLAIALYFDLTHEETALLRPYKAYFYDVQVRTTTGAIYTCELGRIVMQRGVTEAVA